MTRSACVVVLLISVGRISAADKDRAPMPTGGWARTFPYLMTRDNQALFAALTARYQPVAPQVAQQGLLPVAVQAPKPGHGPAVRFLAHLRREVRPF
jgi:hypothetical protein